MTTVAHRTPTVLENVAFVETTRPATPPPMPKPVSTYRADIIGAGFGLTVALAGLVNTALTQPEHIGLPIGATLVMTAVTCGFTLRHDVKAARQ